jgi:hypothetical protein
LLLLLLLLVQSIGFYLVKATVLLTSTHSLAKGSTSMGLNGQLLLLLLLPEVPG